MFAASAHWDTPTPDVESAEPGIGVGLHQARPAREVALRMRAATVGRLEECRRRRISPAEGPVIAHIGRQPPGARLALGQHGHRGIVGVDARACEYVSLHAPTSGISVAAAAPTQSAKVETSRSI